MKIGIKNLPTKEQEKIIQKLTTINAIRKGHFVLSSGRHSETFIGITKISSNPLFLNFLVERLAQQFQGQRIDIVASPALSGILFGGLLALKLKTTFAYAELVNNKMLFRRGFDLEIGKDKKVLIADDTTTTGKIIKKTTIAVEKLGAEVVGYATIWQREKIKGLGVVIFSLINKNLESWSERNCPFCFQGQKITLTSNRRGEEFLKKYGEDPNKWPARKLGGKSRL